jgi:outer membrane protein assembly factor BamB
MNKHIIIASWDGHVYFLDLKGKVIHSINVETPVTGSLLWRDRYLYFDTLKKGFFIYGETKFQ